MVTPITGTDRLSTAVLDPAIVVLGPCPGCNNWQLEYPSGWSPADIEAVLREHANECPPLLAMAIRQVMSAGL